MNWDDVAAQAARNYLEGFNHMANFKAGDKVRLKDSPYEGVVTSTVSGMISFAVHLKTDERVAFTVSNSGLLEHVFNPKVGDVYSDKNGREWVIREGNPTYSSEPYLLVMLIDTQPKDRTGYPYTQMLLQRPEKIAGWAAQYKPVLVRRRNQ